MPCTVPDAAPCPGASCGWVQSCCEPAAAETQREAHGTPPGYVPAPNPPFLPCSSRSHGVTSPSPAYTNTVLPAFVSCDSLAKASYEWTKALASPFLTMDFMQVQPSGPEKPFPTPSPAQPFLKPLGFRKDWGPPTQLAASTHTERPFPPALPTHRPAPAKPRQALGLTVGVCALPQRWGRASWEPWGPGCDLW